MNPEAIGGSPPLANPQLKWQIMGFDILGL